MQYENNDATLLNWLYQIPFLHPLKDVYRKCLQEPIPEEIITYWKLVEEEFSCIRQILFTCTTTILSHHAEVTSYSKVQIRNSFIWSISAKNTACTNHIVAYMNKSSNSTKDDSCLLIPGQTPEELMLQTEVVTLIC